MDNGPGIPASIRSTLFDPFVSSGKPNGTGLGLAIVNKIIHDHGGSVSSKLPKPEQFFSSDSRALRVP
jgi:nitrogen-specific signal transduction histidine kinase